MLPPFHREGKAVLELILGWDCAYGSTEARSSWAERAGYIPNAHAGGADNITRRHFLSYFAGSLDPKPATAPTHPFHTCGHVEA